MRLGFILWGMLIAVALLVRAARRWLGPIQEFDETGEWPEKK